MRRKYKEKSPAVSQADSDYSRHQLHCNDIDFHFLHRTGKCQYQTEPGGRIPLHTSHNEVQGTHTFSTYVGDKCAMCMCVFDKVTLMYVLKHVKAHTYVGVCLLCTLKNLAAAFHQA